MQKNKTLLFIRCVGVTLLLGFLSGILNRNAINTFAATPALSTPGWLFPIVWTILYILMGTALFLVLRFDPPNRKNVLIIYAAQLLVNITWPFLFFSLNAYFISFVWILLLWYLIYLMIKTFTPINKPAGYLLYPYLIWVTFASILTLSVLLG